MAVGKQFDKRTPLDAPVRSYGVRKRYKGRTVKADGYPRAQNVPAGGNAPRKDRHRGRRHTKWARIFWEQSGKRSTPPRNWARGYK